MSAQPDTSHLNLPANHISAEKAALAADMIRQRLRVTFPNLRTEEWWLQLMTEVLAEVEQMPCEPKFLLTRREFEIAQLVHRGLANRQIAAEMFISLYTVKFHISNTLKKLGVSRRGQIATLFERGLIGMEPRIRRVV